MGRECSQCACLSGPERPDMTSAGEISSSMPHSLLTRQGLLRHPQAIPDPRLRLEKLRPLRIRLELLSQLADVDPKILRVRGASPHFAQEELMGQHLAGVLNEYAEAVRIPSARAAPPTRAPSRSDAPDPRSDRRHETRDARLGFGADGAERPGCARATRSFRTASSRSRRRRGRAPGPCPLHRRGWIIPRSAHRRRARA